LYSITSTFHQHTLPSYICTESCTQHLVRWLLGSGLQFF
jgi:hypothetical protein